MTTSSTDLFTSLWHLNAEQLRRLLVDQLTQQKLGLYWESNAIARDAALNADVVLVLVFHIGGHGDSARPMALAAP